MSFNFQLLVDNMPIFINGLGMTLLLSLLAVPLAIILGVVIALLRLSENGLLRTFAKVYLEVLRNVPFLILLFLVYYLLPFYGIRFSPFVVGLITLSMYASAYFSEIFRSAILSLPAGQLEAAKAFGLGKIAAMRHIVFPQLPPFVTPPIINQSSTLVKDTSLLSAITVQELTMSAQIVQLESYEFVEPLLFIALMYLVVNMLLSAILNFAKYRISMRFGL